MLACGYSLICQSLSFTLDSLLALKDHVNHATGTVTRSPTDVTNDGVYSDLTNAGWFACTYVTLH